MNWVPVHDRVKYFSLLHTQTVLWAYTASCKGVGEADSLRWMLDTHMHLVFRITPLFHACFLVLQIPLCWQQLTQPVAMLFSATASLFKYRFHPCLAWQNTEYFQILYHKWRIFCKLLDVWINFTEDIINTNVMFYHFQHEGEYCNSDHILWVDGLYIIPLGVVTCHKNYASNICDRSANYFYSGLRDTPWQYLNIWHVIISHSHIHLCNTHLQRFQLLF